MYAIKTHYVPPVYSVLFYVMSFGIMLSFFGQSKNTTATGRWSLQGWFGIDIHSLLVNTYTSCLRVIAHLEEHCSHEPQAGAWKLVSDGRSSVCLAGRL